jgi:hypothetical protein
VAKILQGPERDAMRLLMMKLNKSIVVRPQPQYHVEQYDLHGKWSRPEMQGDRGRPPVLGRRDQQGGRGRDGRGGGRDDRRDNNRESDKREQQQPPPPPSAQSGEQKPQAPPAEKVST